MPFAPRRPHPRRPHSRRPHRSRASVRLTVAAVTAAALLALTATAASAHIIVTPDVTASGGYAELVFRVPSERPSASTTKVVLTLPQTSPFTDVSVESVTGWVVTVTDAPLPSPATVDGTTITKAPHVVTWTATGAAAIAPGEYQNFAISAGPLPAPGMLELPVDQTYSDGSVVPWTDPTTKGAAEPEHPAPSFEVTTAVATGDHHAAATSGSDTAAAALTGTTHGSSDTTARSLSGAALVVALGAVALQLVGRRRHAG